MRKPLLAAVILLLLANVAVLAGVAYNRSGPPLVSIELTERELPIQLFFGITDENTATALSIEWSILDPDKDPTRVFSTRGTPPWLDDDKLVALGFDIEGLKKDLARSQSTNRPMIIEAILVLEYDGGAHRKALSLVESGEAELRNEASISPEDKLLANKQKVLSERLTRLKQSQSRLYVIDAGLDIQALRQRYAGQGNNLFMRGEIALRRDEDAIKGRILRLSIGQIHIPLPFSELLSDLAEEGRDYTRRRTSVPPRYTVRLNIGKRLEPWIESVTLVENKAKQ